MPNEQANGLGERGHNASNQCPALGAAARRGEAPMSRLPGSTGSPLRCTEPLNHAAWTARRSCRAGGAAVDQAELIAELAASNPHLRQEDAELIVATIFEQITAALARGERVELRGFGAFTVKQRNARIGRNPCAPA